MALSLGLKPLKLSEALKLYDLIGRFIPEQTLDEQIIEFVGKIVDNVVENDPSAYAEALLLMTKMDIEELTKHSTNELLKLFVTGLTVNDIVHLKQFCKDINYGNSG